MNLCKGVLLIIREGCEALSIKRSDARIVVVRLMTVLKPEYIVRAIVLSYIAIRVEVEAAPANFVCCIRHRRVELAKQCIYSIERHLPDAEEAENMVDTVCIEVLRHLAEAGLPPAIAVLCHLLPIIDWEAPILTCYREVIRWSTGRRLHYEELRRYPRIDTDWAHTDRNIALEHYAH